MNKWNKRLTWAFVVVVLLLASMPGITMAEGDCTQQSIWNLDSQPGPPTDTLLMEDAFGSMTQLGSVEIIDGATATWVSDVTAASGNVTFGEGAWYVELVSAGGNFPTELTGTTEDSVFVVDIGRYQQNSQTFLSFDSEKRYQITALALSITCRYTVDSCTLLEGERLALKVTNETGDTVEIKTTGGYLSDTPGSSLTTPCCQSGNFTPELTTGILLGVGLLGLGGYIFIKRRRAGKASN